MKDLKPCPFCGGAAVLNDYRLQWSVTCFGCSASVVGERSPEPDEDMELDDAYWERIEASAVTAWNTRAQAPAAQGLTEDQIIEGYRALKLRKLPQLDRIDAFRHGVRFAEEHAQAPAAEPLTEKPTAWAVRSVSANFLGLYSTEGHARSMMADRSRPDDAELVPLHERAHGTAAAKEQP